MAFLLKQVKNTNEYMNSVFGKYSQKANKNKVNKIVLIMLNVGNHNSD